MTERADWLRGLLIAEREQRGWSLEQTARAIARELGRGLTKQSLNAWELGEVTPKLDQFAAWASALGLKLEVDLVRPTGDQVPVRLPPQIAPIARDMTALAPDDIERVADFVSRLKRPSA